jgi:uncharacterized membrane protein YfhO
MQEGTRYLYARDTALPIVHWLDLETGQRRAANLAEIEFNANSVSFELGEPGQGWLIFSQPFFPGWRARIEGRDQEIEKKGIFMGLRLRPDDQRVELLYRPRLIWLGLAGILLCWVALGGALFRRYSTKA